MTPDKKSPIALREESLRGLIHTLRAEQVMLDRDLATLYQVETRALKQAVKRNIRRFPDDFMFVLDESEVGMLVSQSVIPTKGVLGGAMPFAFTEQGVAALSSVLTSERAIEVNIAIMRAFVSMRRLLASSTPLLDRLETLEKRQMAQEIRTDDRFEQLFTALETANVQPVQGIFFDGQVFDAYVFVNDLLRHAQRSIVLIDNFIDDSVLLQLAKRSQGVSATVLTKKIDPQLEQDLKKHNSQYPSIRVEAFPHSHDRFLILDDETVYHIGASLKDLGKKWFAFSRMDTTSLSIMARVREVLK
ncbi:MAG: ORF6N domain-containing protein [Burkholderiales bacterium]|nr:ORF6N domain-containing protein [Burkholderiales bacterium]MCA3154100.1 ORF6N domain-containing protein [Burkholderiales bacterium]MCA3156691.1 ORF6N domain-containing protein [Burkholderiales bacterium]